MQMKIFNNLFDHLLLFLICFKLVASGTCDTVTSTTFVTPPDVSKILYVNDDGETIKEDYIRDLSHLTTIPGLNNFSPTNMDLPATSSCTDKNSMNKNSHNRQIPEHILTATAPPEVLPIHNPPCCILDPSKVVEDLDDVKFPVSTTIDFNQKKVENVHESNGYQTSLPPGGKNQDLANGVAIHTKSEVKVYDIAVSPEKNVNVKVKIEVSYPEIPKKSVEDITDSAVPDENLVVTPITSAAVPTENLMATPDTEAGASDTEAAAPDTKAAEPGTEAAEPGTEAAEPGTEAAAPDTKAAEPGTEAAEPGTEATEPGTEATEPGTEAAAPDTKAAAPDTEAAAPDTKAATPDTNSAVPDKNLVATG
ncbi:hypothetical protein BB561_000773 [Smittium simulii]|uniref:Uncharacterized protein n=1 Tax=Smittium simulii TaxID=133385 RepID=A0A2T9YXJ2_9FUNG|nr:hypothetical protein BB561_000773 [Smittium simulii]